jgi:hypothetical protein
MLDDKVRQVKVVEVEALDGEELFGQEEIVGIREEIFVEEIDSEEIFDEEARQQVVIPDESPLVLEDER